MFQKIIKLQTLNFYQAHDIWLDTTKSVNSHGNAAAYMQTSIIVKLKYDRKRGAEFILTHTCLMVTLLQNVRPQHSGKCFIHPYDHCVLNSNNSIHSSICCCCCTFHSTPISLIRFFISFNLLSYIDVTRFNHNQMNFI